MSDQQPPSLLSLPRELRDAIYVCSFVRDENIELSFGFRRSKQDSGIHQYARDYIAFSTTCRQLRIEASEIFFGMNHFDFWTLGPSPRISSRHVELMRHIQLMRWLPGRRSRLKIHIRRCDLYVSANFGERNVVANLIDDKTGIVEDASSSWVDRIIGASSEILEASWDERKGMTKGDLLVIAKLLNTE